MKPKLIIVEGVDGTGKTTLINHLKEFQELQPLFVFNYTYPSQPSCFQNMAFAKGEYQASVKIFAKLLEAGFTVICDRFHIGEFAYGPVKRGYPEDQALENLDSIENWIIDFIGSRSVREVLLSASVQTSLNRIKRKGSTEEYLKEEKEIFEVGRRYLLAIPLLRLPCLSLFTDELYEGKPRALVERVLHFIKSEENL